MNLEDIMPSEISSHRRTNTACFHFYEGSRIVKFIETKNRIGVAGGWGEEEMGGC